MTEEMTAKVAPTYDGRQSFFTFEDVIDDSCYITELEPEKRGSGLRNRLEEMRLNTKDSFVQRWMNS